MPTITLMIGLPASGKSTYARRYLNTTIISSDALRAELYGDENDQRHNREVFQVLHARVQMALAHGEDVVVDATNLTMKSRRPLLDMARRYHATAKAIIMATPFHTVLEWNEKRERHVLVEVLYACRARFQMPCENEGFRFIEMVSAALPTTPLCYPAEPFDQMNPHHHDTLQTHVDRVCALVKQKAFYDPTIPPAHYNALLRAAQWHDIGKPLTQTFDDAGVAHYYGHASVGAYEVMVAYRDILMTQLVCYHMEPFQLTEEKGVKRFGAELWHLLQLLHEADVETTKKEEP